MQSDPIVDEVRRVRQEIERKLGSDREAFFRHRSSLQALAGDNQALLCPGSHLILIAAGAMATA